MCAHLVCADQFHRWQNNSVDVIMIARIVCAAAFTIAFIVVLLVVGSMIYAVFCEGVTPLELLQTMPQDAVQVTPANTTSVVNLNAALAAAGATPRSQVRRDKAELTCGSVRCTNLVEYISVMPTLLLLVALFILLFAPIFCARPAAPPCVQKCFGFVVFFF